jgi:hypothetical protein
MLHPTYQISLGSLRREQPLPSDVNGQLMCNDSVIMTAIATTFKFLLIASDRFCGKRLPNVESGVTAWSMIHDDEGSRTALRFIS